MPLINKTDEYWILMSLFPEYLGWIHYESGEHIPIEETIKSHGKWVVYGSKERVESLANILKNEIGDEIKAIKYSEGLARVTPNAPYDKHALIVYCHDSIRDKVLSRLKTIGVEEATWKYDRESYLEDLQDPSLCWREGILHPKRFKRIVELLGVELDPDLLQSIDGLNRLVDYAAGESRKITKMIEEGEDPRIIETKIREFREKMVSKSV